MSGSSTFPLILPKPSRGSPPDPPPHSRPPSKPPPNEIKRKRSFVALACMACRKRKTKCNGRRPICSPCEQRSVECRFDFPDDVPAAQRGKRVIERLSQANLDLKNVIENLRAGDEEQALAIVRNIRAADTLDNSLEFLVDSTALYTRMDMADSSPDGLSSQSRALHDGDSITVPTDELSSFAFDPPTPATRHVSDRSLTDSQTSERTSLMSRLEPGVEILPITRWTSVPGDDKSLSELLTLFWMWDTTFTRVIDRSTFEADLRNGAFELHRDSPRRQFCSVFLVNAMLGFACAYTSDRKTFAVLGDPSSRGRLFIEHAEAEIESKRKEPSFDFLQGLVMLFANETRIGNAKKAKTYIELVFEVYRFLHFDDGEVKREIEASDLEAQQVIQAKSKAAWGLYIFEWRLSHIYGQRKRLPRPSIEKAWQADDAGLGLPTSTEYWWFPWPKSVTRRRSYYKELFDAECYLIEIAEDILIHIYPDSSDARIMAPIQVQALILFRRLSEWKLWFMDTIPEEAMDLPQALHICYCYEMLVVFTLRKVTHLSQAELGTTEDPQSLCHVHTNHIVSVLWTYRSLYTIRYEFWAIQACALVAFSTMFNMDENTTLHESFEKVCKMLFEISEIYPISSDFLLGIRVMVAKHGIRVSKTASRYLAMVDRPRQAHLTEQWRASLIVAKIDGMRGGVADVSLGDLIEGFDGSADADHDVGYS